MALLRQSLVAIGAMALIALASAAGGCGGGDSGSGFGPSGGGGFPTLGDDSGASASDDSGSNVLSFAGDAAPAAPCTGGGLACYVPPGCTTSLSGTVYDPAGNNPLYNVVVFVPNDPNGKLPAIQLGTHSCNTCDVPIGNYVAVTTTDTKGHFTLTGVPAASHVPLVIQTGKWRREVFLNSVTACKDNAVPATLSRLPRNRGEGSMPQMALVTGGADNLGCFMRGMGIDPSEFSAPHAGGRLDIYQGSGGGSIFGIPIGSAPALSSGTAGNCTNASCPLWSSKASFEAYDIVLLACEGGENLATKPAAGMQALHDWLGEGGKVFATHFHYVWFKNNPQTDFQNVATWLGVSSGSGMGNYNLDVSFPKGQVFHDWLANAGALTGNAIALNGVANSLSTINAATSTRWIYDGPPANPGAANDVKYLSFLTPIGGLPKAPTADGGPETHGPQYCGKAVFSDLHAGGSPNGDIPAACTTMALDAQEKALEFLFFDLSACVAPDTLPPPPPPMSVQ